MTDERGTIALTQADAREFAHGSMRAMVKGLFANKLGVKSIKLDVDTDSGGVTIVWPENSVTQ